MKIRTIKIENYKILNNFEISFLDKKDKPLDLIVLAGINGSGKTTLFEFIIKKLYEMKDTKGNISLDASDFIFKKISMGVQNIKKVSDTLMNTYTLQEWMEGDVQQSFKNRIIYIKAQEQKTKDVKEQILSYVDTLVYEKEMSAKEAYIEIRKKLDNIFDGLDMQVHFSGIDRDKNIFFENSFGEKLSIDELSTGEKELLSKIFYLYIANITDSIVLVDEPENSLHPSWQNRVVKIYKNFAKQNNNQIIIATHSPQIVASTPNESLRVLVKEGKHIKSISPDAYGMDVNKALTDVMGVNELRDIEVEEQYKKVKNLILSNEFKTKEFKKEFEKLEEMMQNDSLDIGLLKLEILKREKEYASNK